MTGTTIAVASSKISDDYDLSKPTTGLRQGLTSYGDAHFSLFLRKAFIKALGYGDDALSRPIIGIINTYSSFNPCHANVPQLIEATKGAFSSMAACQSTFLLSVFMNLSLFPQ